MGALLTVVPWWARLGAVALAFAGAGAYGYTKGCAHVQQAWDLQTSQTNALVNKIAVRQSAVTTEVVTKYIDRVQTVTKQADAVLKEVPIYVHDPIDPSCGKSLGAVGVLVNSTESGAPVSSPAAGTNAASTTPSAVAAWAIDTIKTCQLNSEQLTALQQWVTLQAGTLQ